MKRRNLLKIAASCCAIALPSLLPVWAAGFPERPIRILLGYPAGGTTDVILRQIAQAASKHLGQSIIIENRPGGGSTISLLAAKNAAPDGYTLSISTVAAFTTPIQVESTYDPLRDTTYIVGLTNVTYGVVVNADTPFKTFADLVEYAKANPGKATYGAPAGPGNTGHQAMVAVSEKDKLDMTLIPYKGSADLQQALLGNQITFAMDGSGAFGPMVQAGKERLLAVVTEQRMPLFPNVPSLKELGYAVSLDSPWGLVGPPGMDPAIVKVLHGGFKKALDDREVRAAIIAAGQVQRYMDPQEYRRYAIAENDRQKAILTKLGLARKR
ncbi:Bug family tripartite tricarboxylate transporter substrate binding protein [Variovorax sp. LT1R16]|uniref:Bug family tripartite tricarboxylate transporter substrate binding protein n=1 Tax=Variovorax sp. LT1R16 TaxID=3443728 RepID=UPI003F4888B4